MRLLKRLEGPSVSSMRMRRAHCLAAVAAIIAVASSVGAQDTTHAQPPAPPPADTGAAHGQPPATTPADTSPATSPAATIRDTSAVTPAAPAIQDTGATAAAAPDTGTQAAAPDTGQAQSGQTHTVKKGDTLWDLSHTYLGDPFLWPEIYRLNTDVVEDPHWIYPGEKLRIPGGTERTVATDVNEPRFEPTPVPTQRGGHTVFMRDVRSELSGANSSIAASPTDFAHSAVRAGEVYAAPWVDRSGGPREQGQLVAEADIPGIAHTVTLNQRLGPQSRGYITLPSGVTVAKGDRLLVFAKGGPVGSGQLMIPTAVVEVERPGNGEATTVRVVRQFGQVDIGQNVTTLGHFEMPTDQRPAPVESGLESQVISVPSGVVLPTIQRYVILAATSKDGVKAGDEFTLYRPRKKIVTSTDYSTVTLPEEPIALAQVVKVTDEGTTAILLKEYQPAINVGAKARLTARMP